MEIKNISQKVFKNTTEEIKKNKTLILLMITLQIFISFAINVRYDYKLSTIINEKYEKYQSVSTKESSTASDSTNNSIDINQTLQNKVTTTKNYTITNDDKNIYLRQLIKVMETHDTASKDNLKLYSKISEQIATAKTKEERDTLIQLRDNVENQIDSSVITVHSIIEMTSELFDTKLPESLTSKIKEMKK
jgi:hypothetical protein